jgi:hypothetical protein
MIEHAIIKYQPNERNLMTPEFIADLAAARIEMATETALEAFWAAIVEEFPEITSGDFDPMLEGAMTSEAEGWVKHWFTVNKTVIDTGAEHLTAMFKA